MSADECACLFPPEVDGGAWVIDCPVHVRDWSGRVYEVAEPTS